MTDPLETSPSPDVSPAETLRRTQQSLDETQQLCLLGSWEWDIASGGLAWSAQTFRNFGLEPGDVAPTFEDYLSRLHPDDRELVTSTVQAAVISGQPFDYYHRLIRPDGEVRTVHARGGIVKNSAGGSPRMVGTGQDVTEILKLQSESASLVAEAATNRRMKFLSEGTEGLYATMDYEGRLAELARYVVPTMADWCAVDIAQEDGSFKRLAILHSDPAKVQTALEVERQYPEDPTQPTSRTQVLATGTPAFLPTIPPEMIDESAKDARHAKLLQSLGLRSAITVPLIAREKKLGTLTVVMAESGRNYDELDLALVKELGRRAAVAIDNARLHLEVQKRNDQLQDLLEEQQAMNETLSAQAIEMEVAQESLRDAAHDLEETNRELRNTEARYSFLSDAIPVQVWTSLPDGQLDYVSGRAAEFFGLTPDALVGSGWANVVHPEDLVATAAAWQAALTTGEPYETEFRLRSAQNEWAWHLGRAMPLRDDDGNIVRWFGSNTNIDVQKKISEERERLKHEAQAANKAKMEFLAAMSHELRTPLNAINGYADLLLMEIPGPLVKEQHDFIARIQRSGKFLLGLINDVLSFAKIDAGALEVRRVEVNIGDVLNGIHTLVEPQIKAKNQVYTYNGSDEGCSVLGDHEKIEQVVLNLLTNASKFTRDGGTIDLLCTSVKGEVLIAVRDSGRGIDKEQLESIFDPFVQVDRKSNESSQQGVGLGLAISRELARAMGGDLTVESTPGVGSTFTFSLPTK
ncbi:MAG: PAS domain-containing protein [Gemmatimonadaceae bacterium]